MPDGKKAQLGKVLFRVGMRKPLEEALKWQKKKIEVDGKRGDALKKAGDGMGFDPARTRYNKKIFEVSVIRCRGLKRADPLANPRTMEPFFSFDFYTFDYRSPTATGADPTFEVTKRYEIEDSPEVQDYFKYQFLKIDFIDESVDLVR